ncbi:hypothetical protein KC363_g134 [Hortaea werneckii]|nr:hypothetical protein KC363_g134 [Hortaea werneckii]
MPSSSLSSPSRAPYPSAAPSYSTPVCSLTLALNGSGSPKSQGSSSSKPCPLVLKSSSTGSLAWSRRQYGGFVSTSLTTPLAEPLLPVRAPTVGSPAYRRLQKPCGPSARHLSSLAVPSFPVVMRSSGNVLKCLSFFSPLTRVSPFILRAAALSLNPLQTARPDSIGRVRKGLWSDLVILGVPGVASTVLSSTLPQQPQQPHGIPQRKPLLLGGDMLGLVRRFRFLKVATRHCR